MPSIRADKQIFPFFDSVKTPISAAGTSESFHNNGFSTLMIEVSGASSIDMEIEGCINILDANGEPKEDANCVWTKLGLYNLNDFSFAKKITGNGIYAISIDGTARVRVVVNSVSGNTTILGSASV